MGWAVGTAVFGAPRFAPKPWKIEPFFFLHKKMQNRGAPKTGRFDIFIFIFCLGEGKGSSRRQEEGGSVSFLKIPRVGGSWQDCRTHARPTAVQAAGVLQYKWEVCCWVSLSGFGSQGGTAIQMRGVLPYKLELYCGTVRTDRITDRTCFV